MIFRDKNTGALLNIRKDEFINDRTYYNEIINVMTSGNNFTKQPRYTTPFVRINETCMIK